MQVNPLVQNSNSLLEDLRRLNQLKENFKNHDIVAHKSNQHENSNFSKKTVRLKK